MNAREIMALKTVPEEIRAIVNRTYRENPMQEDIEALRMALQKYPQLWRGAGDLSGIAETIIVKDIPGPVLMQESIRAGLDALRGELGWNSGTGLERILIEQVVLCKLQLDRAMLQQANLFKGTFGMEDADFWERTVTSVQRRYLRAVETLARVRRLMRSPTVQVNIGAQQVNVAKGDT